MASAKANLVLCSRMLPCDGLANNSQLLNLCPLTVSFVSAHKSYFYDKQIENLFRI